MICDRHYSGTAATPSTDAYYNCEFTNVVFSDDEFEIGTFYNCLFTQCRFNVGWLYFAECNFTECDFEDTSLQGLLANFTGCTFSTECELDTYDCEYIKSKGMNVPQFCPSEGSFIAWKKCRCYGASFIVKLFIPEDAKRVCAGSKKCRANKAQVLEIQCLDGRHSDVRVVFSHYDPTFAYEVGKTVFVTDFNEDGRVTCSQGIHFFIDRNAAVHYRF